MMKAYTVEEHNVVSGGEPFASFRDRYLTFLKRRCEEAHHMSKDDIVVLVAVAGTCNARKRGWLLAVLTIYPSPRT